VALNSEKILKPSKSIFFDLDGTLIDSKRSVFSSLTYALNVGYESGRLDSVPNIDNLLIGPPLKKILEECLQTNDQVLIANIEKEFINHYDSTSFLMAKPFEGIEHLLVSLKLAGIPLFIVTNKRRNATIKIIKNLDWGDYFQGIACPDDYPECDNKAEVLCRLNTYDDGVHKCIYVGDTQEDFEAAIFSKMQFIGVGWGFGQQDRLGSWVAASPRDLYNIIFENNL
jgi:phosphoglycolate phosphatase